MVGNEGSLIPFAIGKPCDCAAFLLGSAGSGNILAGLANAEDIVKVARDLGFTPVTAASDADCHVDCFETPGRQPEDVSFSSELSACDANETPAMQAEDGSSNMAVSACEKDCVGATFFVSSPIPLHAMLRFLADPLHAQGRRGLPIQPSWPLHRQGSWGLPRKPLVLVVYLVNHVVAQTAALVAILSFEWTVLAT